MCKVKEKIKKIALKTSIRYRFLGAMILVAIVPAFIITMLTSYNIYDTTNKQVLKTNKTSLLWSYKNVEEFMEQFSYDFYALEMDSEFKEDLIRWGNEDLASQYKTQLNLSKQISSLINSDKKIKEIDLCSMVSNRGIKVNYSQTDIYFHKDFDENIWKRDDMQKNLYFKRIDDNLCVLHQINRFEDRKFLAGITIIIDPIVMENIYETMIDGNGEQIYLVNDENEIVDSYPQNIYSFENLDKVIYSIDSNTNKNNYIIYEDNYIFSKISDDGRFRIIKTVPTSAVISVPFENVKIGVFIGAVSLIIAIILATILSGLISKPIVKLSNTMHTLDFETFKPVELTNRDDEIALLENGFNSMISRINELINIEYRSEIEIKTAELKALQAQINPHFLNNTLQLIGGMSLGNASNDVYKITLALSEIMRYSINFTSDMVTVNEELKYLNNYLLIQNNRYGSCFKFTNNIPKEIYEYLIPKLSLQPILENCFEHGFKSKGKNWCIAINGSKNNDDISITISDNGKGISPKDLTNILESLNQPNNNILNKSEHIGLKNVDTRFKIYFGQEYGVSISSIYEKETNITLMFKAMKEEKINE